MKIDVKVSKIYSYTDPVSDLYMCGALNVGRKGYFSDHPDFSNNMEGVLESVNVSTMHSAGNYFPFKMKDSEIFKFFCPEECAVEAQPELRPYRTLDELPFKIGDSVTCREKGENEEMMLTFVGTVVNDSRLAFIHLGAYSYTPKDLFEDHELFNGKEWVPFGVEV